MAKTRGRPKGSGKYQKSYRIRLSEDEYEKMKELSELFGIDMSLIIRALIDHFIKGFLVLHF